MYTDTTLTNVFNGLNKWYYINEISISVAIGNDGVVASVEGC